jgi:small-conductance mechanosensitive channel
MNLIDVFMEALDRARDQFATMIGQVIMFLPQFIAGIIVLLLGWLLARLARRWAEKVIVRLEAPEEVESLIVTAVHISALLLASTAALAAMGVKV